MCVRGATQMGVCSGQGTVLCLDEKSCIFQGKSIKSLKYDANNTQDTEPSPVLLTVTETQSLMVF